MSTRFIEQDEDPKPMFFGFIDIRTDGERASTR